MAKVLGKSGRFVSDEAAKRSSTMVLTAFAGFGCLAFMGGILCGAQLRWLILKGWYCLVIEIVAVAAGCWVAKWMMKRLVVLENERNDMRRGIQGESAVAAILSRFPDEFRIINDVKADFGNVDHVVVGPTGVFLLDDKNWRGTVEADRNGELLLNRSPTQKPYIKQFTGRVMGLKDKVRVLARGTDPYFRGVFVFTSASVKADWGKTGQVHCIREVQLWDYIVESKLGKKLSSTEVDLIAGAFASLARMDSGFETDPMSSATVKEPLAKVAAT